jgi:hypothetical protein
MLNITQFFGRSLALAAASIALAGCSKKPQSTLAAAALDSAGPTTDVTPSVAPGAQVTRTDAASVTKAMEFKLTQDDFSRFMAAADSVAVLATRDTATRAWLTTDISGSGSNTVDAGLKWLQSNAAVSNAISSAGMTPQDYFIESIAVADAQQYMSNPKAAPATPTAQANADFVRAHSADLDRLKTLRAGGPASVTTAK